MRQGVGRLSPALVISLVALFAALGGTVYAAARIDGKAIKLKSLPGNRLKVGSVPGNRLKPGALAGGSLAPGSVTGTQVDASTLGQVPSALNAVNAESAGSAQTAVNAQHADDALNAVSAVNAEHADNATTVNGHTVQCAASTTLFHRRLLGQPARDGTNRTAAATDCAVERRSTARGASALLPSPSGPASTSTRAPSGRVTFTTVTGLNVYGVVTVSRRLVSTSHLSPTPRNTAAYSPS